LAERSEAAENSLTARNHYLEASGLDGSDVSHYDQAYAALAQRGLIQVDRSRIPVRPRTQLTEDQLYSMPLEQLKDLAGK